MWESVSKRTRLGYGVLIHHGPEIGRRRTADHRSDGPSAMWSGNDVGELRGWLRLKRAVEWDGTSGARDWLDEERSMDGYGGYRTREDSSWFDARLNGRAEDDVT